MSDNLPPAYLEVHPPARSQFRHPRRDALSGVIVVHTAESVMDSVGPDTGAENVAGWIATRTDGPGSYHDVADADTIVHVVDYDDEAYHDGTGSNRHSLGLSFAVRTTDWAKMTAEQRARFIDNGAQAAARMARHVLDRSGVTVPARRINRAQSEARQPGFISHAERDPDRRSDPGNKAGQFPWDDFLDRFAHHMDYNPEDDMPYTEDQLKRIVAAAVAPLARDLAEVKRQVSKSEDAKAKGGRTLRHIVATDLNNGD